MNASTGSWFGLALGSLALAGALAACREDTTASNVTSTAATVSLPAAPAATKPTSLADEDIAQAIWRHFQDERLLRPEHVHVAVAEGVATLSGSVGNLLAKRRALAVTGTIRGVRSVVDEVTVAPIARTDDRLASDVTSALRQDEATRPYPIDVAVKDGTVTLAGNADSFEQRHLFEDVAEEVPGVKAVVDHVVIHYAMVRPDSEIAADVKHRISNDVWLDGDVFSVIVAGHTVRVRGIVASAAERSRARDDAWVAGVDAGTLDSWGEIKTSAEDATFGGATRVVNLLKLREHPEFVAP